MGNYYFLVAALPPIQWGVPPEMTFDELKGLLAENLTRKDRSLVQKLLSFIDISNIRQMLLEEPIDPRGNLTEKELDEALLAKGGLPEYVFDFLSEFEKTSDQIRYFSKVIGQFFNEETRQMTGFLQRYFTFERHWRLVMMGLRAKQAGRDLTREIQFEDPSDSLIAHLMAQKDAERYDPPVEYMELKELMQAAYPDPLEEYRAFSAYRLRKIEEMEEGKTFSMDVILSYIARLIIVEEDSQLNQETGKRILTGMGGKNE